MSHILFVENRHRTRMWEIIATGLKEHGHTVSWLVMNHGFAPRDLNVHLLPYPQKRDLTPVDSRFARIAEADRQVRYYGRTPDHYSFYYRQIRTALEELRPEVVIGEIAQFYELLTIEACRDLDLRYIVPTSARYPTGRFVCCDFDTLDVVGGSGEVPSEEELISFVHQLVARSIVPDYMKGVTSGRKVSETWKERRDWAYKALQYVRGERYCSPPPSRKLKENKIIQQSLEVWDRAAREAEQRMGCDDRTRVLFPLHKQPEASVDVWGRPYSNQAALVSDMADALGDDAVLLVKPNPKPGRELSDSLLRTVLQRDSVLPLASTTKMQDVFDHSDLIVTVTGTVAIEAIFARKPCATLIRSRNNDVVGCRYLTSPKALKGAVTDLRRGRFAVQTEAEVLAFAARLYAESYPGIIHDPFSTPEADSVENRKNLTEAFGHLIPELLSKKQEVQLATEGA